MNPKKFRIKPSGYDYKMLRITLILLVILAAIFWYINSQNYGNYIRGAVNGTYQDYVFAYGRSPNFDNDKYSKKILFFESDKITSTAAEQLSTSVINANLVVAKYLPSNLALVRVNVNNLDLAGKYKVITPNTFLLLDEKGNESKRLNSANMDLIQKFIEE